jgi:hypothetical protein
MKVFDIIIENNDLNEAIPFTKQWSKERQATKAVKGDAKAMLSDLAVWMKGGGIAKGTLTADQFKSFLNQKGLGSFNVDVALKKSRDASGRDENEPLSGPEATDILNQAIRTGFIGQGARGSQSRFADPAPSGTGGGGSGLPGSLTSAISGLTPQQKAALKAML